MFKKQKKLKNNVNKLYLNYILDQAKSIFLEYDYCHNMYGLSFDEWISLKSNCKTYGLFPFYVPETIIMKEGKY